MLNFGIFKLWRYSGGLADLKYCIYYSRIRMLYSSVYIKERFGGSIKCLTFRGVQIVEVLKLTDSRRIIEIIRAGFEPGPRWETVSSQWQRHGPFCYLIRSLNLVKPSYVIQWYDGVMRISRKMQKFFIWNNQMKVKVSIALRYTAKIKSPSYLCTVETLTCMFLYG